MLVILKLSAYADCDIDAPDGGWGCNFEFKDPLCTVTSLLEWPGVQNQNEFGNVFTITGSGFNSETTFFTDGFKAEILDFEDDGSSIRFLATRVFDEYSPSLELYCSDGLPVNYNTVIE